jgi:multiple sugar transport system permease protein
VKTLKEKMWGILLLLPAIIFLAITSLFPLLYSLYLSFQQWNITISPIKKFVGLQNYIKALKDPEFLHAIQVTVILVLVTVTAEVILGLLIALLVTRERKGQRIVRALLLIPMVMTPVAVGVLFRMLYNPDVGLFNYLLSLVGIAPPVWLADPKLALISIMLVEIWEWTPFVILCLVAGLTSLPVDVQKAATVDGASSWQIFFFIKLPLLWPIIAVVILMRIIDAAKIFDSVFVLTYGGPGNATEPLSLFIYNEGLRYFHVGYASAVSWFFILIMFVLTGVLIRQRQKVLKVS